MVKRIGMRRLAAFAAAAALVLGLVGCGVLRAPHRVTPDRWI